MGNVESSLLLGLIGAVLCLFGFSLYMGGLRMIGFFLGGSIGALIGLLIAYAADLSGLTVLLLGAGVGIVGALLGLRFIKTLHRVAILLIGAALGFLLGQFVLRDLGGMWSEAWVPFASVIVGAVLFFLFLRYIITLVTASVGAYLLFQVTGLAWVMVLAFAIGLVVQIGAYHGLKLEQRVQSRQD